MKPYLIAEVGVNFYDTARALGITPIEAAEKYIEEAKNAGADAVKFQSYKADTLVSKNSPAYWDMSKEPTKTQHALFSKHDGFCEEDFRKLYECCKRLDIDFMSTPFDYASADYLEDMVKIYKISSSDLSNLPFIRYIARKGKPIYLSVGAAYLSEIEEAVRAIEEEGCPELCLMHCVLSYPCKYEDANLNMIRTLQQVFPKLNVGYSDHTLPDEAMTVLSAACLLGARVIEKHFTLDKTLPGNDHYHAGDPEDFRLAVKNFELIGKIGGQMEKCVLPCEEVPRREARRSLVLTRDIKAGEVIRESDLMAKRPGYGISPNDIQIVAGRKAARDLEEDTVLMWDMV